MKPCCPGPPGILVKATGSGHLRDSRTPVAVGHTGETLHLGSSASEQEMSRQPLTYLDESDSPGHTSDRFLLFSAFNFLSSAWRPANLNRVSVPQISFFICITGKCCRSFVYCCPAFRRSLPRPRGVWRGPGWAEPGRAEPWFLQPPELGGAPSSLSFSSPPLQSDGRGSSLRVPPVQLKNNCRVCSKTKHLLTLSQRQVYI